ncbi:MAG: hypothetical protein K5905_23540 [Roseibium sp.]|uniref:hypothetical protein n=1 Tax=Roseibium sp. TaxID=1936156 RepID=UPI002613BDF9|nr:hypothetical protein [Roseibium sp.]MCV0428443.1 hypothetical protein [Roseibium sp.]
MSTLIICDPGCHNEFGHNIDSVIRYYDRVKSEFDRIVVVVAGKVERFHKLGYNVEEVSMLYPTLYLDTFNQRVKNKAFQWGYDFVRANLGKPLHKSWCRTAKKQIREIIKRETASDPDVTVYFPSADYYFVLGCAELLVEESAKFHLSIRFIGVLENASIKRGATRKVLFHTLRKVPAEMLTLQAEAGRYSEYLNFVLNHEVETIGLPINQQQIQATDTASDVPDTYSPEYPLVICLPGKSREDKGGLHVTKLARSLMDRFGMSVVLRAQNFNKGSRFHTKSKYLEDLFPNIDYLPSGLPRDEFEKAIWGADAVLLPYTPGTYWYRGSAIFFESLEHSKLMIGRGGNAFVDDHFREGIIRRYYTLDQLNFEVDRILRQGRQKTLEEGREAAEKYRQLNFDRVSIK